MTTRRRIRHRLTRDVELGEQFRDAQQGMDTIPLQVHRTQDVLYTEPLALGGFSRRPAAIEAICIVDLSAQETPVLGGGVCPFLWRPDRGGALIQSVDGMSVAANGGKKYRITFRLSFEPAGGFNG